MNKFPNASVVIVSLNRGNVLRKVLNAMLKLSYPAKYEVIVVENGSQKETKSVLREFEGNSKISVVDFVENQGVCVARNAGIAKARFEIVVNMDHDCIPDKNWLKDLVSGFDSEKVGGVTAYGGFGGTSTAFRKELLGKVGGYDEDYWYYREDTDLAFKIIELGYEFKQVKASYLHEHTETKPKGLWNLVKYVFQRWGFHMNDVLLYKKHPNDLCKNFLNIKFGFLVNPFSDIALATGKWHKRGAFRLSSPRGIVFLENRTPVHALIIFLFGFCYMLGLKFFRLMASFKHKKLLI